MPPPYEDRFETWLLGGVVVRWLTAGVLVLLMVVCALAVIVGDRMRLGRPRLGVHTESPSEDPAARLERLQSLHVAGLITDAELHHARSSVERQGGGYYR